MGSATTEDEEAGQTASTTSRMAVTQATCPPPSRVGQHVAIGTAAGAAQPPGPKGRTTDSNIVLLLQFGWIFGSGAAACSLTAAAGIIHRDCSCES